MSWLHNNLLLPWLERERHQGLRRRLRDLQRFEAMPEARQRAAQADRVSRILQHAYDTVPFYRKEFEAAGSHPRDWKPGQPVPLPVTGREHLRDNAAEMVSRKFKASELRSATTGGTTSTPVQLKRDIEGLRNKMALQYQLNHWAGYDQGDTTLSIWGSESDLTRNPSWKRRFYEERVLRQIMAPAGQLNQKVMETFLWRINKFRPSVIFGYGVTTSLFAEFVIATGGLKHRPRTVIVTAEAISREQKDTIELAFGCKVWEHYGSRELGMLASECEQHDGLHFHPAGCLVEYRYEGEIPDGAMYRLIVTDLLNYGLPLLRYDTGDNLLLANEQCKCGRWFPRVKTVLGRAVDTFVLPDGSEIPGVSLNCNMFELAHTFRYITQMQVVQKKPDMVQLRYVSVGDEQESRMELLMVRDALRKALLDSLEFETVKVDDIPRAPSGKLRLCVSEVPSPRRVAVLAKVNGKST